jgi:hypothetical protein
MKKPRKHESTKFSFFVPSYFRVCVVLLLFIVLLPLHEVRAEDDIHGSAHLTHTSTDTETGGEKTSSWQFTQVYNLGVSKALTPKVGFTADLDVNVTESNEEKTTRLSPDLRLDVTNEYFDANTGYRINERGLDILTMVSDEDRYTTESWNANISTKSEKYPKVRLRYNEDRDYDHLSVHETDSKTTNFSGSADYTFQFLNFNYEYRENTTDNYVDESIQETDTHEGRVNFRKSFLDNKITSSGSYSITNRKTQTETQGEQVRIENMETPHNGLFNNSTPASGTLSIDDSVINGTANINVGSGNTDRNIGVDLRYQTEIEEVRLLTEPVSSIVTVVANIWEIYSSPDNITWNPITSSTSFDYSTTENRFEISFVKTTARYFKVVNTSTANATNDVYIKKIEAYSYTTYKPFTTTETERTTETIQASLGYKPTDWLSFTYDFTQDDQKTEPDDQKTTRDTHNVSGRVERELHKYLTAWAQYRRRWENDSEADDTTTDTYLLHFLSSPLETLDTDLSFNHTVSKEESETRSRSSSGLFQITAKLREGADLDVDANITRTENLASQSETTTKSLDSNLRLELTRMLTAEIEYNWNWTDTEQPSGDTTGRTSYAKTTLYWRPSHEFYFRGSYSIDRNEISGEETTQQQYNMSWLMTEKMQLDMGYTVDKNDTDSLTYYSDLSWNLSRVLTLRFGYDWSRQETSTTTETQTITSDLSARF